MRKSRAYHCQYKLKRKFYFSILLCSTSLVFRVEQIIVYEMVPMIEFWSIYEIQSIRQYTRACVHMNNTLVFPYRFHSTCYASIRAIEV